MRRFLFLSLVVGSLFIGTTGSATHAATGFVRGIYDGQPVGRGFNAASVQPLIQNLDAALEKGYRAKIWLGDFKNCRFQRGDAYVRDVVRRVKNHPGVLVYHLADEPFPCSGRAPSMFAKRTRLIKSIDQNARTYVTLPTSQPGVGGVRDIYPIWAKSGAADIYGLVVYPKTHRFGYAERKIPRAIAAADAAGFARYWAIIQNFGSPTAWYARPTARELKRQFDQWDRSNMKGYWVYRWQGEGRVERNKVLRVQNSRNFML